MIILTKILCIPSLCSEIVLVVVPPSFWCCFLRNGKSILDPKGDFHKKYLIIITILRDDDRFFVCVFAFYFVSFCYRMHKEWTIFLWFLFLPKTISKKVFKVALYFYLNDIWKNELFTNQKSLSFMWLIMHFYCLNINFKEN